MPSEQSTSTPLPPADLDLVSQQVKVCSCCRAPVPQDIDYTNPLLLVHNPDLDPSSLCAVCRDRSIPTRQSIVSAARNPSFAQVDFDSSRRPSDHEPPDDSRIALSLPNTQPHAQQLDPIDQQCSQLPSQSPPDTPYSPRHHSPSDSIHHVLKIKTQPENSNLHHSRSSLSEAPSATSLSPLPNSFLYSYPSYSPDPLADVTRLRVRSPTHHCLYPGATFSGTQKSGRSSYDVNVTIVDVDFSSSFLCGYLRIRGLTEDWPELTTYFDAEIIGSRYGFLTRNWGATEQEDMVHWQRFPAFRHVKSELKRPYLTIPDNDRGAVFMRWKERFLVPDHRVQDINGASFAGFYYVCVDFNHQPQTPASKPMPLIRETEDATQLDEMEPAELPPKTETSQRSRRRSIDKEGRVKRLVSRSSSRGGLGPMVATMSGFYFHQNSEPYQQLSLNHVPEATDSCFELR